jgi:hypothetical protein
MTNELPNTSNKTGHPLKDMLDELSNNGHWPNPLDPTAYTDIYDILQFCGEPEEDEENDIQYLGWPL